MVINCRGKAITSKETVAKTRKVIDMTKVTCPFCGSSMEIGVALTAGQHVICPYCEKKFVYGECNAEETNVADVQCQSLVNVSCPHCGTVYEVEQSECGGSAICQMCNKEFVVGQMEMNKATAENTSEEEQKDFKFCSECGAKMPVEAAFCPKCGRKVRTEEEKSIEAKFADASDDVKCSGEEQCANPEMSQKLFSHIKEQWSNSGNGKVQKLFSLLWLSAIVYALSVIVGCFIAKEYYSLGQTGYFIVEAGFLAIHAWLYIAIMHRKSWARKTFIVLIPTTAVLTLVPILFSFELSFATLLNVGSLIIGIYCVYLCFDKEIVGVFLPDSMSRGIKATVNRHHCIAYLVTIFAWFLISGIWGTVRYGSNEWGKDCMEALLAGSSSAKKEMIEYVSAKLDEQGVDYPDEQAKAWVEFKENSSRNSGSNDIDYRKIVRDVPGSAVVAANAIKFGGAAVLKVVGLIVAGISALVGGFLSKQKKG